MQQVLITILGMLIGLLVLILVVAYFISQNTREKQVDRKWTDPKFHD